MDKRTAVEWLINELKTGDFDNAPISVMLGIIEKAFEMEKEQIQTAYVTGYLEDIPNPSELHYYEYMGEQYYNETYNNEQGK
jgi:hypothetical protein